MNERREKELEIRFVGDDNDLRRKIRNALVHGVVRDLAWSRLPDFILSTMNSLLVIEYKGSFLQNKPNAANWFSQVALTSPLMFFSSKESIKNQGLISLTQLFEDAGAKVFVGESGKRSLIDFLCRTSERDPANVIASLKVTDSGLTVVFADDVTAIISFSELKRLAETDEILLNEIRIAGDRTYLTVGTKEGESVPIPHDVLRESAESGKKVRQREVHRRRSLTAKKLGVRIQLLRGQANLSQEKLAEKMGKSRWTVIRIESGEYLPKVSDLQKLSRALNVDIGQLLGEKDYEGSEAQRPVP